MELIVGMIVGMVICYPYCYRLGQRSYHWLKRYICEISHE